MQPKFFQIGFHKCGTTFIARLFDMNGIPAAHWLEGALAEDIAYAKLTGRKPLARWADDTVAFTDMESVRFLNTPVIEAFRDYAFLDQHYPGSVFLLNTRRVEDWIVSRYLHRGGAYARSYAAQIGVPLGDLADIWAADWDAHLAEVRAHFAGRAEFIEIDIDEAAPEDYRRALSPWFDLRNLPALPGAGVHKARQQNLPRVEQMLAAPPLGDRITPASRTRLATRLADLAAPAPLTRLLSPEAPHPQAICLDLGRNQLRRADGSVLPLRRGPDGQFYLEAQRPALLRVATTANDIARIAGRGRYWLDMRPEGPDQPAQAPLIAALRRKGDANVFLWPAPWLHRIGNDGFPGAPCAAGPRFQDRADTATWRGPLSGYGADVTKSAESLIAQILSPKARPAEVQTAAGALQRLTRWRLPQQHAGTAGLDLALVPDDRLARALQRAGTPPPAAPAAPPAGRYALCLGATQGDADLLPLIQTNAVVLKEDDGWQSMITGLFRPWRHYIPLAPGATDLALRLDWARAHPVECAAMVTRAHRLVARLADPEGRRLHLARILAAYRAATGQD
ncbi:MAG: hypothetical protein ACK4YU_05730 [Paracoccus sp. (in: a-proteobacteria)]